MDKMELPDSIKKQIKSGFWPRSEVTFHFTDKKIDLKLLNKKIIEYLLKYWAEVYSRHHNEIQTFEIIPEPKPLKNGLFNEHVWPLIAIRGEPNDFTINFSLDTQVDPNSIGGSLHFLRAISYRKEAESRVNLLRDIEDLVYSLEGTGDEDTRQNNHKKT